MEKPYHIVSKDNTQELAKFWVKNGQALLPMVELIEQSRMAVDELIDILGRAQIEAVLRLSAEGVAGPPHPGKKGGAIGWHGREEGTVCLKERKLRVKRPRLRKKGQGEEGDVPRSSGILCVNGGPLRERVKAPTILHSLGHVD